MGQRSWGGAGARKAGRRRALKHPNPRPDSAAAAQPANSQHPTGRSEGSLPAFARAPPFRTPPGGWPPPRAARAAWQTRPGAPVRERGVGRRHCQHSRRGPVPRPAAMGRPSRCTTRRRAASGRRLKRSPRCTSLGTPPPHSTHTHTHTHLCRRALRLQLLAQARVLAGQARRRGLGLRQAPLQVQDAVRGLAPLRAKRLALALQLLCSPGVGWGERHRGVQAWCRHAGGAARAAAVGRPAAAASSCGPQPPTLAPPWQPPPCRREQQQRQQRPPCAPG